jgi:hypothetical protein
MAAGRLLRKSIFPAGVERPTEAGVAFRYGKVTRMVVGRSTAIAKMLYLTAAGKIL